MAKPDTKLMNGLGERLKAAGIAGQSVMVELPTGRPNEGRVVQIVPNYGRKSGAVRGYSVILKTSRGGV